MEINLEFGTIFKVISKDEQSKKEHGIEYFVLCESFAEDSYSLFNVNRCEVWYEYPTIEEIINGVEFSFEIIETIPNKKEDTLKILSRLI